MQIPVIDAGIGIAVNLLLLLSLTHAAFPRARKYTQKFFDLSYYNQDTERFGAGWDDASFVVYWIVIFTGLRVAVMEYILFPFAQSRGIRRMKMQVRFAEQAWVFIYDSATCSLGVVSFSRYLLHCSERFSTLCTILTIG